MKQNWQSWKERRLNIKVRDINILIFPLAITTGQKTMKRERLDKAVKISNQEPDLNYDTGPKKKKKSKLNPSRQNKGNNKEGMEIF